MGLPPPDFESGASAIPPRRHTTTAGQASRLPPRTVPDTPEVYPPFVRRGGCATYHPALRVYHRAAGGSIRAAGTGVTSEKDASGMAL